MSNWRRDTPQRNLQVAERTNTVCTLSGSDTVLLCALQSRLPPEVNRILFVRNLPFKITSEELYDLFGRYGAIRQIRKCATPRPGGWCTCT